MREYSSSQHPSPLSGSAVQGGSAAMARERLQAALRHDRPDHAFTARRLASAPTPVLHRPTANAPTPATALLTHLLAEPLVAEKG